MSNNIFRIIGNALKVIIAPSLGKDSTINIYSNAKLLCLAGGIHATYAYGTSKTEDVTIVNKYQMDIHGYTRFMIHDDKGRHYAVDNSLWYWKWDSVEDWIKMYKGDRIKVKYYGIRFPLFGLFPIIIGVETDLPQRKWIYE